MVSVVPSIIPILTANAVAANQVKRKNKSLNNKEKKLKDSPLNNKINCRVFLNNGKVIEGHYEGNWYEDNSDEEGIWIKTDNGIEEINSKDYDRIEYYHKKTVNEAYIKAEKGNIYYTKNSDMFLSMVKSIFISKNIPVRVYYDTIKQMYVFGNAFDYIHADLATSMKYYSKIYGVDEMRANVSYLKENCALFQVLPDDNFKKYDMGDGYTQGWFLKIDDLYFACRNKEFHKSRDNVPLFKGLDWQWIPTDYYIAKKQGLTESIEDKILYIIRGVPGSGKSTLAHKLTDNVVEADQYFYDDEGNYNWSADKLNQAHNWCFYTVKKYMEEGRDKIAVANTFVKNKDYKRYVELAKEFGYKVDIRTCTGNYQNIHNVPDETVEKMRSKFQETPLDESAENDKTLRDYAVKLADICLDALVKTKYETKISNKQIQINVDKAFKKAVPMLKNSHYEYFIILVSKNDEPNASYGKTVDRKYGLITLPVFSKDPIDQTLSILHKHKSMLNKLYSTYSGDELKLKLNEYAIKYLKKELEKSLSNVRSKYLDILIHECTHLLDDVRRTKTYKSKEQNLKDDKGIENYYNSPEEQNAFYQETVSIFDEWANQSVRYKTFDIFWDDFIRQYRGEYNMLNDKNKRKLKKRAYAYWYVYMKD